jgi:hypothetical protein
MTREQIKACIDFIGPRIFTVTFTKKDGTLRRMNARLGVIKHANGGKNTTAHIGKYITVFDMEKQAYRNVNLDTIEKVTCGKRSFVA